MSITTELLVQYFCGDEAASPEGTLLRALSALLLGASPPANEDVCHLLSPMKRGPTLSYENHVTSGVSSNTRSVTCYENLGRFYLHSLPFGKLETLVSSFRVRSQLNNIYKALPTVPGTQDVSNKGQWPPSSITLQSSPDDSVPDVQILRNSMWLCFSLNSVFSQMQQRHPNVSWVTWSGSETFIKSSVRKEHWRNPSHSVPTTLAKGSLILSLSN